MDFFPNTLFIATGIFNDVATDANKQYAVMLVTGGAPFRIKDQADYTAFIANGTVYNYIQKGTLVFFNDTQVMYKTGVTPDILVPFAVSIPYALDTSVAANLVQVSFPSLTAVIDGQIVEFNVNNVNTGTAGAYAEINGVLTKEIVDQNGERLKAGVLKKNIHYMAVYNVLFEGGRLQLIGVENASAGTIYSLGTAKNFVILTGGVATVTNSPQFIATGDTGENVMGGAGVFTFGAGVNTGGLTPASASVVDVKALYDQLKVLVPTNAVDLSTGNLDATNIGFGLGVFVPGIYKSTAAVTTGGGPITLSGDGDYVFIITAALTFFASTVMNLTNGAKASRVYFVISTVTAGQALTTGAIDTLKGTYIVGNGGGAIVIGATNDIEGHIFTTEGEAITIDGTATNFYLPLS